MEFNCRRVCTVRKCFPSLLYSWGGRTIYRFGPASSSVIIGSRLPMINYFLFILPIMNMYQKMTVCIISFAELPKGTALFLIQVLMESMSICQLSHGHQVITQPIVIQKSISSARRHSFSLRLFLAYLSPA